MKKVIFINNLDEFGDFNKNNEGNAQRIIIDNFEENEDTDDESDIFLIDYFSKLINK